MSRNLCQTHCAFCRGGIQLLEEPHVLPKEYFGPYWESYLDRRFARSRCEDCWAEYLAWMSPHPGHMTMEEGCIYDLSHYSTFNDEPGEADIPKRKAVWVLIESDSEKPANPL